MPPHTPTQALVLIFAGGKTGPERGRDLPKATQLISIRSRLESWMPLLETHRKSRFFQLDYIMNFLGLALAGLGHSARTQDKSLVVVLCVYQCHLRSSLEIPDPLHGLSVLLGHGEGPGTYTLASLMGDSMQVESTVHTEKHCPGHQPGTSPGAPGIERLFLLWGWRRAGEMCMEATQDRRNFSMQRLEDGSQRRRDYSGCSRWRWWDLAV